MAKEKHYDFRVDIVSDVVCPWCIIGYLQFDQAVKLTGAVVDLHWHPFELNPHMPPEGQNLREHIQEKYGSTPEESAKARLKMIEIGDDLGFTFRYSDASRMVNTFKAHQLMHWANAQGRQHDLKMELFIKHFTEAKDISKNGVLVEAAVELGLDDKEALSLLRDERYAEAVRHHQYFWTSRGIQGVPAMVFNEKHLVTGAQGTDNYVQIIRHLTENAAA